ncbi:MAG: collagen-like protein, partial [Proteobacteria bacterium]|nr:collagen-like protein [Pseudomonadota bacterium]
MDIEVELAMEKPYATICTHCRALDHMIEDCPALMDADKRRRKVVCKRCGKQGHDITACLDEIELEKEKKIREAIQKKTKELEAIEVKIKKLGKTSGEIGEPQDRDINTPPSFKERTSTGRGDSKRPPKETRDQYPGGPQTPRDNNFGRGPAGGEGGGPPDDPGDNDGDEGGDDDDDDDENEEEETDEEDEQSEMSEDSELSDFLYDIKGNKIDIGQLFQEWQNSKENKPPVRIVRGPRGHRGARGKPGRKGPKGDDSPIRNLTDSGFATNNVSLNTSGLEDSFKELGNSMKNVWTVQRDLNTSMRDHIQITAQVQQKNTEAL